MEEHGLKAFTWNGNGVLPEDKLKPPVITWNESDVAEYIELFGFENAIRKLAGDRFQEKHVRKVLEEMIEKYEQ